MTKWESYLPFWSKLTKEQQKRLSDAAEERQFPRGTLLHNGSADCVGLLLVLSGQLRVYTASEEGRELTLYRLLERDLCLFSASCILSSIQFEVMVSAEQDCTLLHIPSEVYHGLMEESLPVAQYTNQLMASRFSDVMWLMDQILTKKLDSRLAALLLEERSAPGVRHFPSPMSSWRGISAPPREVVTRMLRYFQNEGLVTLSRGVIGLSDLPRLEKTAAASLR